MSQDIEVIEDEGINPESIAYQDVKDMSPESNDPIEIILYAITSIRTSISKGQKEEALQTLKNVNTLISMGMGIAEMSQNDILKSKLQSYKLIVQDLEEKV